MTQYLDDLFLGDARRCPRHGVPTSSPDGLHDAPCNLCEAEMDYDLERCNQDKAGDYAHSADERCGTRDRGDIGGSADGLIDDNLEIAF